MSCPGNGEVLERNKGEKTASQIHECPEIREMRYPCREDSADLNVVEKPCDSLLLCRSAGKSEKGATGAIYSDSSDCKGNPLADESKERNVSFGTSDGTVYRFAAWNDAVVAANTYMKIVVSVAPHCHAFKNDTLFHCNLQCGDGLALWKGRCAAFREKE